MFVHAGKGCRQTPSSADGNLKVWFMFAFDKKIKKISVEWKKSVSEELISARQGRGIIRKYGHSYVRDLFRLASFF